MAAVIKQFWIGAATAMLSLPLGAQPDFCSAAHRLALNASPLQEKNHQASILRRELPRAFPYTCIQSFENDLWFEVISEAGISYYEAVIDPVSCNTPAGLQALVIQAADCDTAHFQYLGCANPKQAVMLRLGWEAPLPGARFLIYVDGYDGTQCEFLISVAGYASPPSQRVPLRPGDTDFFSGEPGMLAGFGIGYRNNELILEWQDDPDIQAAYYLAERVYGLGPGASASVRAVIPRRGQVGMQGQAGYQFIDRGPFRPGEQVCYRIVGVTPSGERFYYQTECVAAMPVRGFSASAPLPDPERPGVFLIQYNLFERQALTFELQNGRGEALKSFTLSKKAEKSGFVSLNMEDYPVGLYRLRIEGRDGGYAYEFDK